MKMFILFMMIVAFSSGLTAAEKAGQQTADEAAIRKAVQSYVAAFQLGDAKALARHWSNEGVYVSPSGQRFQGRAAIEKEFAAYFAESSGEQIEVSNPTIRFLTPSVAIEEGTARVTQAGEPPVESSYLAVHVKQGGAWRLDSVRETVIPTAPSHYEYLKDLEWMIGEWVDEDGNSSVETVCAWTKNKNFITRSFKVSIKDHIDIEGTQVIGWDPAAQSIRSWMFDSDGGFGDALWSRQGNRWTINASRTLNGGEKASAINVLTYVDDDHFTWQSTGREIDGELLPNIEAVTVVRKQSNK